MLIPSCLLAVGAILTGVLFKEMFIGHGSLEFWSTSILFLESAQHIHPPTWLLVFTPTLVVVAIPIDGIDKTNDAPVHQLHLSSLNPGAPR